MIKVIISSIVISVLGFFPLMGMPGILVLMLSKPFIYLTYGPMAFESFEQSLGSSSWALLLMLSIVWPISIPIAYGLSQKLFGPLPFFSLKHLIPFCVLVLIGTIIISSLTVSMNSSMKRLSDPQILEQALKNGKLSLVKDYWTASNHNQYAFGDPLYIALENKQSMVAHYLLDNGVSPQKYMPDFKNYEPGITPLHTATTMGMIDVMEKLLKLGISPNIQSTNGKTPLHNLGEMNKKTVQVIDLLKIYKADFAAVDNDGNTALLSMALVNAPLEHRPMLALKLIEYGCPPDLKNKQGETALSIVQKQQSYDLKLIEVLSTLHK